VGWYQRHPSLFSPAQAAACNTGSLIETVWMKWKPIGIRNTVDCMPLPPLPPPATPPHSHIATHYPEGSSGNTRDMDSGGSSFESHSEHLTICANEIFLSHPKKTRIISKFCNRLVIRSSLQSIRFQS
jgi:hypothetical protein